MSADIEIDEWMLLLRFQQQHSIWIGWIKQSTNCCQSLDSRGRDSIGRLRTENNRIAGTHTVENPDWVENNNVNITVHEDNAAMIQVMNTGKTQQ